MLPGGIAHRGDSGERRRPGLGPGGDLQLVAGARDLAFDGLARGQHDVEFGIAANTLHGGPRHGDFAEELALDGELAAVLLDDEAAKADAVLANADAESIDAAREEWWIGLRSAEKENYRALGGNFDNAERDYRRGFEVALRHSNGTASADRVASEAYQRGYDRGTAYHQQHR
jgi:hypothetical protein